MSEQTTDNTILNRAALSLIGWLAGLCLWLLVDVIADRLDNEQLFLFLVAFSGAFFIALLGIAGPLSIKRAALVALIVALPSALLLFWASLRFSHVSRFMDSGQPLAFAVLVTIPLPFLMAQMRKGENWRDYPALFGHSWGIVVRYAAAWMFTGLFWAVLMLSNELLNIVGLKVIEDLLDIDLVPFVLTGLVLGLAIAVVHELAAYLTPVLTLILRLLRLLLPMVLVVVGIFILALPFRGLSGLFGGLSATLVLIAMAAGAATLVTTVLDQTDEAAVHSPMMRLFAQALALLIPVLAALAAYAVWVRVGQYGWTPNRMAAATVAVVGVGYGVFYALAVVRRDGWMARIRTGNIYMSFGIIGLAALWLSPLINPQRISTNNQIARFGAGKIDVEQLALWKIGREWGSAGKAGIERLKAMEGHKDYAALQESIARMQAATSSYGFRRDVQELDADIVIAEILSVMPILPAENPNAKAVLQSLNINQLKAINADCAKNTPAGNPRCVMLFAELSPTSDRREAIIFYLRDNDSVDIKALRFDGKEYDSPAFGNYWDFGNKLDATVIDALIQGNYSIQPTGMNVLHLNGQVLYIGP